MALRGTIKSLYLRISLFLQPLLLVALSALKVVNVLLSLSVVSVVIYGIGFQQEERMLEVAPLFNWAFVLFFVDLFINVAREFEVVRPPKTWYLKALFLLFVMFVGVIHLLPQPVVETEQVLLWADSAYLLYALVVLQSVVNVATVITQSLHSRLNPAWVFVGSFMLLIAIGTGLLLLPRATHQPIRVIDALFTSVSSVCVTGLMTLDFVETFTIFGKTVIAILVQLGGIGIMTFTCFFGMFFTGKHQSQNKMMIKDLVDPDKGINQIFRTLWIIILVTLSVELVGAYLIFVSVNGSTWNDFAFSLFHSVSAFCNAGLSTIPDGLFNAAYITNYSLHWLLAILVILGGIGFPIIFNVGRWLLHVLSNFVRRISGRQRRYEHIPHLLSANTRIVLVMTAFLLFFGTLIFYVSERHNVLEGMTWYGRLTTAFFMSATPRTAGFVTFDFASLMPTTLLWYVIFMWIGASPMSTGGGVKTTTIGIALLNVWHTLRGRDHIEVGKRRISETTVNRAFIIIFVSLVMIAIGILCLSWLEPNASLREIVLETVAAVSTAGMSLGLTSTLCDASRVVIMILMFVGRVGVISILSCFIKPKRYLDYQYPSEIITIN